MATTNGAAAVTAAAEAIKEHFGPAFDKFEKNVRQARRAVVHGTQAAEDFAEAAVLEVRRHPLRAAAIAAGVAVLAGGIIGFAFGRKAQR